MGNVSKFILAGYTFCDDNSKIINVKMDKINKNQCVQMKVNHKFNIFF